MALEDDKKKSPYAVDADTLYNRFRTERPTYNGSYDTQLTDLYNQITTRPNFQYDATQDPLYQGMKDQYIQGGKLAMRDTMGQAAALTGGYGSSYGQQVGQQAFDAYLQNLSAVIPDLYNSAYGRWQDEGDRLLQQYSLLGQQRDAEYGRYRDELSDWENERAYQTQLESQEYSRQQQAFSNLYALIGSTGYSPTDQELAAAGMSREAANALLQEYLRGVTPAATGGGGGGGGGGGRSSSGGSSTTSSDTAANTGNWGFVDVAGVYDNARQNGASATDVNQYLAQEVKAGTITQDEAKYIRKNWQVKDRI